MFLYFVFTKIALPYPFFCAVQDHQAVAAAVVLVHDPQVVLHQIPGHRPVLLALLTLLDHHVLVVH